jgi:EAL domain-containing protein (putative c-di-GMP-specific phosphodiesterase class I)
VDSDAIAIVQAIVGMASTLVMRTTAEGVENADQAQMLRDTGCTQVQGYMFGRPCGQDLIAGLMRDNDRATQPPSLAETQAAELAL